MREEIERLRVYSDLMERQNDIFYFTSAQRRFFRDQDTLRKIREERDNYIRETIAVLLKYESDIRYRENLVHESWGRLKEEIEKDCRDYFWDPDCDQASC